LQKPDFQTPGISGVNTIVLSVENGCGNGLRISLKVLMAKSDFWKKEFEFLLKKSALKNTDRDVL